MLRIQQDINEIVLLFLFDVDFGLFITFSFHFRQLICFSKRSQIFVGGGFMALSTSLFFLGKCVCVCVCLVHSV